MKEYKTIRSEIAETVSGLGIVRCEERAKNLNGELHGQTLVWYDVCADNGTGDILESFKRLSDARRYAKEANYE